MHRRFKPYRKRKRYKNKVKQGHKFAFSSKSSAPLSGVENLKGLLSHFRGDK